MQPIQLDGSITNNEKLAGAALAHSNDMASNNFFSHTGSDGLSMADRANKQNYNWVALGENIAAGQQSFDNALQGWIDSPGHCENLMSPDFNEVAVACVQNSGTDFNQYWTNTFGAR